MRQMLPLLLPMIIAACSGGGGDPEGGSDEKAGLSGETLTEGCSAVGWRNGAAQLFSCDRQIHPTVEPWRCDCGGSDLHDGAAEGECKAELMANCGAEDADFASCHVYDLGTCVPGDGESEWACACLGETDLSPVAASSCESALWTRCGEECGGATGSCERGEQLGEYVCTCPYYDAVRTVWDRSCVDALDAVCRPGSRPCTAFQGYCDEIPPNGYECGCADGTSGSRTYDELGVDDCRLALEEVCGTDVPADSVCERQFDATSRGECVRDLRTNGFTCQCTTSTSGSISAEGREVMADSCDAALEEVCGAS